MKAILAQKYGPPAVLELVEVNKPIPTDGQVLVKIHAASVNIADWYGMQGGVSRLFGGLLKPKDPRVGRDIAGQVEVVGRSITLFRPGDQVFGVAPGGFAEYARPPGPVGAQAG